MKNKKNIYHGLLVIAVLFILGYFWWISRLTPLAGDDWGYALNGMNGNPFVTLIDFYFSWSGRLLSEFWGLCVAPNKELWNVLNTLLFSGIFVFAIKLGNTKSKAGAIGLLMFLMFSVSEYLRMETYTWIMGTTYVIPLFLSLFVFCMIEDSILSHVKIKGYRLVLVSVASFLIGVAMENIAAMMLAGYVLMEIYSYCSKRKIRTDLLIPFSCSLIGFLLIRLSPGANFRTVRDHSAWMELSLLDKIGNQLDNFFRYTFIENKYLIFILGLVCLAVLVSKGISWIRNHKAAVALIGLSQISAVFFSCANVLASRFPVFSIFVDSGLIWVRLWWILYVVMTFVAIAVLIENARDRLKALFMLLMAGGSNLVMLYSPIFGSRSSLYFVFFMFVLILLFYSQIDIKPVWGELFVLCVFCVLVYSRAGNWLIKYQQVHEVQLIREEEIKYYLTHPEEDAWICRMPPYSIHGGDIEEDDTYHQETFKAYYGLNPEQKLIFYWKDSYD